MKGEEDLEHAAACSNPPLTYYDRATSKIVAIFEAAFGGSESIGDRPRGEQNAVTCRQAPVDNVKERKSFFSRCGCCGGEGKTSREKAGWTV